MGGCASNTAAQYEVAGGAEGSEPVQLKKAWTEIKQESVWNHYDKVKTLGEGMTGAVYALKRKTGGGETYAGKSVSKRKMDKTLIEDLRNEIEVLISLDHPNVVKLYEVYESQTEIYLVMEMCTGGELYDALIKKDSYTENYAAHLFFQMVAAVHYVHSQKLAHRDLKLENFIFENKEEHSPLKLIDFGLSHMANKNGIHRMKSVVGTPYYIAPEVLKAQSNNGGKTYDERCDVWSLGVLLYMLLSGTPPFCGGDDRAIMDSVLHSELRLRGHPWDSVSSHANDIITKCLIRDPSKRITTGELMKHPWMERRHNVGKGDNSAIALKGVASQLGNFRGLSKFKKTAVNLIAFSMTPDKIRELKEAFMACDDNGDGVITMAEFKKGMEGHIDASEIEDVFRAIDTDGGGTIEYSEFLAAAISKETYMREDKLKTAWDRLDEDGNGYLEHDDFKKLCGGMFSEKDLEAMILEVDPDGDGKITWDEFLQIMQQDENMQNVNTKTLESSFAS